LDVSTGPSYEKNHRRPELPAVPTKAATVTNSPRPVVGAVPLLTMHRRLVRVVQDDETHAASPSCPVGDRSATLKLTPSSVTNDAPPRGPFATRTNESDGASYVSGLNRVPIMPETSRTNELATAPVAAKKVTDVSLVHDVVRPAVLPRNAVRDRFIGPKFAPETRKAPPEVLGMLLDPEVILAESNVKLLSKHPTVSESVTATCCACPYPAPVAQLIVVEEDQLVVRQRNDWTAEVMVRYCAAK